MVGRQYGGYIQYGRGGIPVFRGSRMQRGYGIGSVLSGMFRAAVPFLRRGAQTLGKEALRTGITIGQDVLSGRKLKQSARQRTVEAVGKMTRNTPVARPKPRKTPGRPARSSAKGKKGSKKAKPPSTASRKGLKRKAPRGSVISSKTKRAKRPLDIFDR